MRFCQLSEPPLTPRVNGHNGNAIQILGPQSHTHNGVAFAHGSAIVALCVEANQVGFALHGVLQAQLGKLAVAGVGIVQIDGLASQRRVD